MPPCWRRSANNASSRHAWHSRHSPRWRAGNRRQPKTRKAENVATWTRDHHSLGGLLDIVVRRRRLERENRAPCRNKGPARLPDRAHRRHARFPAARTRLLRTDAALARDSRSGVGLHRRARSRALLYLVGTGPPGGVWSGWITRKANHRVIDT